MLTRFERDLQARPMTRRIRRFSVAAYVITILILFLTVGIYLLPFRDTTRLYGLAAFIVVWTYIGYAVFFLRILRRGSSVTSMEERAQLDFGKPYAKLSLMHRFDVRARVTREFRQGGRPPDERDAVVQREAEQRAFRILRIALPIFALVYWGVCLSMPLGPVRVGLLIGAVVMSVMLIPVMILPDVIRLWTEPDAAPEPNVVTIPGEA